jgi:multiple sugar transport system substrate-binding protein/lactose/L-arabinose transport system substrate-binding protein
VGADALSSTVEAYNAQTDGTAVAIERIEHAAMIDEFRPALSAGAGGPDFALLESVAAQSFVATDGLVDLGKRITPELREQFVPGKWDAISRGDRIYALPWDFGPVTVFYRRDSYEEHGIDPADIETWSDFVAAGEKLPDDVAMTNLPPNDLDGIWRLQFRQLGGRPFTEDGEVNIASEASFRAVQNIERIADADVAESLQSWGNDWEQALEDGSIASVIGGAWMEQTLEALAPDTDGNWGVYKLPAFEVGGNRASAWGGSNLCIPEQSNTARMDQAWEYVEWFTTTPDVQNQLYEEFGVFPALRAAYESSYYDQAVDFFGGQPIRRVFAEVAAAAPGYRYTVDTPAVSSAMNNVLERMIDGEFSAREAVDRAAQQVATQTGRDVA